MRVGLVCPYDLGKPGGVQAQVLGLAEHMDYPDTEAVIVGPGLPPDTEGVDLGRTLSIPGNRSKVPLSVDPRAVSRLRAACAELDLLHVHEPLMPVVSLAALRVGKPVVATFHAAPGPLGVGLYRLFGPGLPRILGRNVARVTAVSPTAARPLSEHLDVTIVPNGLDVSRFDISSERIPNRVCFLGRDEKRKGLDVLLAAWPAVSEAVPGSELVIMGADRGDPGVTWMGLVDDATKVEVLASSAVYVAPNLGGESFGIVIVEAMAAGTAVLASDLDAFRHVGEDAVRYCTVGDPDALAAALIELLADRPLRARMGEDGRRRAADFDWARVTRAYREVYERAVS
ncbi:MAG: glycosyltransferase family 4 protein [Acidimicrobiia bacterium]